MGEGSGAPGFPFSLGIFNVSLFVRFMCSYWKQGEQANRRVRARATDAVPLQSPNGGRHAVLCFLSTSPGKREGEGNGFRGKIKDDQYDFSRGKKPTKTNYDDTKGVAVLPYLLDLYHKGLLATSPFGRSLREIPTEKTWMIIL